MKNKNIVRKVAVAAGLTAGAAGAALGVNSMVDSDKATTPTTVEAPTTVSEFNPEYLDSVKNNFAVCVSVLGQAANSDMSEVVKDCNDRMEEQFGAGTPDQSIE